MPDKPINLFSSGNYKTDVKLMLDTVVDEGSFMFFFTHPKFSRNNPETLTLQEAKDIFFNFLSHNFENVPKELISKLYFDKLDAESGDSDSYRRQVGIAFGDMLLGCASLNFAKQGELIKDN